MIKMLKWKERGQASEEVLGVLVVIVLVVLVLVMCLALSAGTSKKTYPINGQAFEVAINEVKENGLTIHDGDFRPKRFALTRTNGDIVTVEGIFSGFFEITGTGVSLKINLPSDIIAQTQALGVIGSHFDPSKCEVDDKVQRDETYNVDFQLVTCDGGSISIPSQYGMYGYYTYKVEESALREYAVDPVQNRMPSIQDTGLGEPR